MQWECMSSCQAPVTPAVAVSAGNGSARKMPRSEVCAQSRKAHAAAHIMVAGMWVSSEPDGNITDVNVDVCLLAGPALQLVHAFTKFRRPSHAESLAGSDYFQCIPFSTASVVTETGQSPCNGHGRCRQIEEKPFDRASSPTAPAFFTTTDESARVQSMLGCRPSGTLTWSGESLMRLPVPSTVASSLCLNGLVHTFSVPSNF